MSGLMAMAGEDVSLWTALGLVAAAFIPVWAAVVWLAKTSSPPSRLVAQGRWAKLIAWLAYGLAAIVLANWGWISVYHGLLGPSRRTEQRVVYGTAIALQLLWIVAAAWAEKRHRGAIVSPPATGLVRPKVTQRIVLFVLLLWVAVAGIFAVWTIGPMASGPATPRDRTILTVACIVIATLVAMLVNVTRKARRETTRREGNATGSN